MPLYSVFSRGAKYARDKRESQRPKYPVDRVLGEDPYYSTGHFGVLRPNNNTDGDFLRKIEKRANMPRKPTRPRVRPPAGKRPRSRPTVRRSTKKRKMKRKAPGGAKKKRKIAAVKYHNHRYEQEGTCNAAQPYMYVGVNDCFRRGAIWDAMADGLLRPILAKEFKFFPLQDTDKIGDLNSLGKSTLVFGFKRIGGLSGAVEQYTGLGSDSQLSLCRVDLDNTTYETQRSRLSTVLQYWADGAVGTAPNADSVAYFPYMYSTLTYNGTLAATATISVRTSFDHVGDTLLDMKFSQKLMFSNRTLAEGGGAPGEFTDRLGTNPLKGKVYSFNHSSPRILDHVDMSTALRASIQSDEQTYGIAAYQSSDAADSHLAHPLAAKFWLKNCVKEGNFLMKPGGVMTQNTSKSIKGKISTLIERFYFSGFDKGTFGQSSLFMFDMVHKSSETPTTTYKRLCNVQSAGKLVTPKLYIPDFEATLHNLI